MAVEYIPFTQQWIQGERPKWSVNGWDMDEASVMWRGPAPLKKAFEDSLVKFAPMPSCAILRDPSYPQMWLKNWQNSGGTPSFPGVELSYVGFRSATIPKEKAVNCRSAQVASATAQATDENGNPITISGVFKYFASRTIWTWFETSQPAKSPKFNTVLNSINPGNTIYAFSGTGSGSLSTGQFTQLLNSLTLEMVIGEYEQEPVIPGALWACRSSVDYKFTN